MSSLTSVPSNNSPKKSTYEISLIYLEELRKLKKTITKGVLAHVETLEKPREDWKISRLARTLIEDAFEEFGRKLREKLPYPNYTSFLENSIAGEENYFYYNLSNMVVKRLGGIPY